MKIRNYSNICILILVVCSVSSCTKYIEFEGEDRPPGLVLNGLIQPDSVFSVELSLSRGYVDIGDLDFVENGQVEIFDEQGQFIESLNYTDDGVYKGTTTPTPGQRYSVKASANNFNEISAADVLPFPVNIVSWDTSLVTDSQGFDKIRFSFTIDDPANVSNFYQIEFVNNGGYYLNPVYDPETGQMGYDTVYINDVGGLYFSTADQILLSEVDLSLDVLEYTTNSLMFSDELFDGSTRTFAVELDFFFVDVVEFRLWSCSSAYYDYLRTKQRNDLTSGDPFSEPVQVFTNISNGLGIWGGASLDKVVVEF